MVLPVDDVPDPGFEELPNSLSRTSSYLRCFSSRSLSAFAWRSSGVSSGGLLFVSSSSESERSFPSALRPRRARPAVADSTPAACRDAICGLRLRTVTAGLKSCFSGTADLVSRKWNVCADSLDTC